MSKKESLCWDCQNCYGNCSWSGGLFIPVEGWTAEFTVCNGTPSYLVSECPMFKLCESVKRDMDIAKVLGIVLKDFYANKFFYLKKYYELTC